jgi:hypothetical protein
MVARAKALSGQPGFVPAAQWRVPARDLFMEHLQYEVDAIIGGVRAEGFWQAFNALEEIAPLEELISTGILIKLRSLAAFLVRPPSSYADELTATAFFEVGRWEELRDAETAARVLAIQKPIDKQVAHLTLTRPLPEEIGTYRPSTYLHLTLDSLTLLEQFTATVDLRLLPEWWRDWVTQARPRLLA